MKRKRGFTLVELVVALLILSVAMVGIANLLVYGAKVSAMSNNKMDTSSYAQISIQYYKSMGKNSVINLYNISGVNTTGSKYGYFDNIDELEDLLENRTPLIENTTGSDAIMINTPTTKKYGVYIEVSKSNVLGKKQGTNTDYTISNKINIVRVYIKVITMEEKDKHISEITYYKGR